MEDFENNSTAEAAAEDAPAAEESNGVSDVAEQLEETTLAPEPTNAPLDLGFSSSSAATAVGNSEESQKKAAEIREKASGEKDQFYAEREKKIEAKKKQAMDEQGMIDEKTIADGWAGVVELIELDQSKNEGRHDLSAMRQLLITLKHKQAA